MLNNVQVTKLLSILVVAAELAAAAFAPSTASAALTHTFTTGTVPAVVASGYVASGALQLALAFAPTPGTDLTVVRNTGPAFIAGTFDGVPHGATVRLSYGGMDYTFKANYYGGNGRSLVLQWPAVGLCAWGRNDNAQLGSGLTTDSPLPTPVSDPAGVLAGKTPIRVSTGYFHSLLLAEDGRVYAWGDGSYGCHGNKASADSATPVPVYPSGALAGKTVVGVAAGFQFSLAATSDGKVFAWGANMWGQLGINSTTSKNEPTLVTATGALAGKTVVAVAAGATHSLAITSDGRVFAWGDNSFGQLGDNSIITRQVPVAVDTSGVLAGKTVLAIAAGYKHSLALTADGAVIAWGYNDYGQLGNGTTANSLLPVALVDPSGLLAGKTVTEIVASYKHSAALASDGTVIAWGYNFYGQLGNGTASHSSVPVAPVVGGVLAGKFVTLLSGSGPHCVAATSDGAVVSWGNGLAGQLGNGSYASSPTPVAVSGGNLFAGQRVLGVGGGHLHSFGMFGSGPPTITGQPAPKNTVVGGTAVFTASAVNTPTPTVQWQVSATGTYGTFTDIVGGTNAVLSIPVVSPTQDGYAYRALFTNAAGSSISRAALLRVYSKPTLALPYDITADATGTQGAQVVFSVSGTDALDGNIPVATTPASGAMFPVGTTTVVASATNGGGLVATGSFTVTVRRSAAWFESSHGLAPGSLGADPFGTGIINLLAYAFGLDPAVPDRSRLPSVAMPGARLEITYARWPDAGDLSYVVEVSGDMVTWQSGPGHTEEVSVAPLGDGSEKVVVRDLAPAGPVNPRRFIRVKIRH